MASIAYPDAAKSFKTSRNLTYGYALLEAGSQATTIVFLHGFPSSCADWSSQITHLTKKGYGVIAFDMLGYGDSSKPDSPDQYGMADMARDILEVLDHEHVQKVHFVAHDAGTAVLSWIISFYPSRCKSATFIAINYGPPDRPWNPKKVAEMTKQLLGYERFGYLDFIATENSWKLLDQHPESMACGVLGPNKRHEFYPPGALEAWLREDKRVEYPPWVGQDWTDPDRRARLLGAGYRAPTNWARCTLKPSETDLAKFRELGKLQTPVLYIDATPSDVSLPPMPMDAYLGEYTRKTVSTTGHWIQLEAAEEVNEMIESFLGDIH